MPVRVPPQLPDASLMIIGETETHIIVAVEISKARLFRNMRSLENLVDCTSRGEWEADRVMPTAASPVAAT
jgi:hypothetical protein